MFGDLRPYLCLSDLCPAPDQQYESHVGRHLEDLALFALPKTVEADDDDSNDLKSQGSHEWSTELAMSDAINRMQKEDDDDLSSQIIEAGGDLEAKQLGTATPELKVMDKLTERKRRSEIKELFDQLLDLVIMKPNEKASKWEILTKGMFAKSVHVLSQP